MFYAKGMEPLENDSFEARIVAALEAAPTAAPSAEFAARVVAALPAQKPRRRAVHAGRAALLMTVLLAFAGCVYLAAGSRSSFADLRFDAELVALAVAVGVSAVLARSWRAV